MISCVSRNSFPTHKYITVWPCKGSCAIVLTSFLLLCFPRVSMMEFPKPMLALFFFIVVSFLGGSVANVYEVGGSDGWSPNVSSWASAARIFQVGDTLVFSYNPNIDSVLQVNRDDYRLCFSISPLSTYKTGKDSITLVDPGEVYFISGNAGNCLAGERIQIKVDNTASSTVPYNPYNPNNPSGPTTRNASTALSFSRGLTIAMLGLMLYMFVASSFC